MGANGTHAKNRRRPSPDQIAFIQRCEGSCRAVARVVGVGKSTVSRYRQLVYDAWEAADVDDSDTYAETPTIDFERLASPRRCPEHGLTHVWPCVQCAAKLAEFE
jgi:hypothetical protein